MQDLARRSFQRETLVAAALAVLHFFERLDHSGQLLTPERDWTFWTYSTALTRM
jgi:hypothetical protein